MIFNMFVQIIFSSKRFAAFFAYQFLGVVVNGLVTLQFRQSPETFQTLRALKLGAVVAVIVFLKGFSGGEMFLTNVAFLPLARKF